MSAKICTAEYMLSDTLGVGMRRSWYPRVVAERFLYKQKHRMMVKAAEKELEFRNQQAAKEAE